ncbi:hypothetical protein [Caldibacillus sp. 210928-DFI.2.22]|uniref:hypothetical protein n=1 Tax=Caldibacillus sp. 210928-DFI.2.22 TaxID=2883265 RepID=UPI001D06AE5F|nr:hypothetical protein [Caldibacillus sp. 210928-DFI.2.22]
MEYVTIVSINDGMAYELVPAWVFTAHQKTIYHDPKKGHFKMIRIGGEQEKISKSSVTPCMSWIGEK